MEKTIAMTSSLPTSNSSSENLERISVKNAQPSEIYNSPATEYPMMRKLISRTKSTSSSGKTIRKTNPAQSPIAWSDMEKMVSPLEKNSMAHQPAIMTP